MKSFPKPLTAEEEAWFLQKYKEGDLEAKRILIERNLRLVAHVAKKYQKQGEDAEDLIAVGTIGLIKAVSTFNHAKTNKLATYAARCVENELLMLFRSRKKISREVSLHEPIGTDKEGNEISLIDVIEGESEDVVERLELDRNTEKLYILLRDILTAREREILKMRYGLEGQKEMTQREIAAKLGISRSYVSRIEKNAVKKLREQFQEEM
ncbi:MAG: RNA polymerase sporulation sigma factor SigK [Eubacteriales bacterium]|nr:RNA polymerase sporulation sigma factor SigK [Eubacteriales bacterium]